MSDASSKVLPSHLQRDAYLYVRQSTLRQVFENTESTKRQYALRQKATGLGWSLEQVQVIDSDQGQSGAERDRSGFQQLVSQVSLGKAGIVMGLEVSRLARNSMDWHRLLEICALTQTLILDEDGIYDPAHFNDRLLLGLKGTMSEAELHVMRARLHGGLINKARRGELRLQLPVGLTYDIDDNVVLEPNQRAQDAMFFLFDTFSRTGSACATVKEFRQRGLKFPRQPHSGPSKGLLLWGELVHSQVLRTLHNPRYAGAFVYGRRRSCKNLEGKTSIQLVAQDQWQVVLRDVHEGYISWEVFESNQRRLLENAQSHGQDRRRSAPREGPALLQGLVLCGKCGRQMTVRYKSVKKHLVPCYICQAEGIKTAQPICQHIVGGSVDESVGEMLVEVMRPMNLDVSLAVEDELQSRLQEAESLRKQSVEQARYDADLARRRFLRVDPDNRLVANALEADWNEKLRELQQAQETYERDCENDRLLLSEQQHDEIKNLARDFPRVWKNPNTQQRERKRLLRLLIEDVTLIKGSQIHVSVRFKGGADQTVVLPVPLSAGKLRKTDRIVVEEIDHLLDNFPDCDVARQLNGKGYLSGTGHPFSVRIVAKLRKAYGIESHYDRLRDAGFLTVDEIALALGVDQTTVNIWRRNGRLKCRATTARGDYLYAPPGDNPPKKYQRQQPVDVRYEPINR